MKRFRRFLSIILIVGLAILLVSLIQNYGIGPLRETVGEMGVWAPFGILMLRGISVILPALPSSVY